MPKQKISVTIDEKELAIIENMLKRVNDGRFRNRSHVIEYSLRKFLEQDLKLNNEAERN
jgi:Arc/MetJ-type ribon-helix-helix transcriptional regulator